MRTMAVTVEAVRDLPGRETEGKRAPEPVTGAGAGG